mmetsp:Transcript_20553/g.48390  ORF Transcript_20553/g.48390 Transcript_20553/m.48390 type:complete len:135 (+) Transcript_20553:2632-3036(+)
MRDPSDGGWKKRGGGVPRQRHDNDDDDDRSFFRVRRPEPDSPSVNDDGDDDRGGRIIWRDDDDDGGGGGVGESAAKPEIRSKLPEPHPGPAGGDRRGPGTLRLRGVEAPPKVPAAGSSAGAEPVEAFVRRLRLR